MGQYTSYYLYQKYEKRGDQPFTPVYPMEYSVDGNGTMSLVTKNDNDPNCGYSGDTPSVQYRWVNAPINVDYVCDECPEPIYRTTSGTPYCDGYNRTVDTYYQVSYDEGETWSTLSSGSTVIAYDSPECGYPIYQWVDTDDYICIGDSNPYLLQYLTFDIISSGTIVWSSIDRLTPSKTISYSKNNGATWIDITSSMQGEVINVNAGDKVLFKGYNISYTNDGHSNSFSESTAAFNLYGNIMSLINGDYYPDITVLPDEYYDNWMFCRLFSNTKVVDASNLILPATTLADYCYGYMFEGCTNLTAAPELPATTLAPACYQGMFSGCTSLTTAPELPARELTDYCYRYMFIECSNLNYVKCLANIQSGDDAYIRYNWLWGVSESGLFVKLSSANWPTGDSGIPYGWTVQNAS